MTSTPLLALMTIAQALVTSGPNTSRSDLPKAMSGSSPAPEQVERVIVDFTGEHPQRWAIVNDGVMGGRSNSNIEETDQRTAVFSGFLSLENNGGFASTRAALGSKVLEGFDGVVLRVRGDGRTYQLRFRMDGRFDGVAYQAEFTTESGEWTEVDLPFEAFQPSFRGFVPRRVPGLDPPRIRQMGILIGDKIEGPFSLELEWVKAYRRAETDEPA